MSNAPNDGRKSTLNLSNGRNSAEVNGKPMERFLHLFLISRPRPIG